MPSQNDLLTQIDITGLTSVTQTQLQQLVATLIANDNIGMLINQTTTPDVASNPRFSRYLWLDNITDPDAPVIKYYNTSTPAWEVLPVAAGSVIVTSIADGAVTYNTKIGGFTAPDDALKVLRVNAAGTAIELFTLNSASLPTINLDKLTNVGGGVNYFLKWNAAGTALVYEAFNAATGIPISTIPLVNLVNGSNPGQLGYIVRANPTTGVIELAMNNDLLATNGLFATHSIPLTKLDVTSAAAKDILYYNGVDWARATPYYNENVGSLPTADGVIAPIAHGLGATPRTMEPFIICISAEVGYAVGDKIPMVGLSSATDECFTGAASATQIKLAFHYTTDWYLMHATTGARTAIDPAKWTVGVYASLI